MGNINLDKGTGYYYFYEPSHPLANKSGKVYVHRDICSNKIGRFLKSDEHVHHIDGNKQNNSPENLEVLSPSEHSKLEMRLRGYEGRLRCDSCGKETQVKKKKKLPRVLCRTCLSLESRLFNPSKEELEFLIWKMSTIRVGKHFGVSDKAVEKRCKILGIKKPPRGYWTKVKQES